MEFTAFNKKSLNTRHNRVDRFIMPRDYISEKRRQSWHDGDAGPSINDSIEKCLKKKKYINHLEKVFFEEPKESPNIHKKWNQPWPCEPRKKTYLSSPDSIMDLPLYSHETFPDLLDWSKDNILVAALGDKYHKWSWSSQSLVSDGFTRSIIKCCKFDPRGELLLLGTWRNSAEIHTNDPSKWQATIRCRDHTMLSIYGTLLSYYCAITAVDWSPTGNSFVTGCSSGVVCSFTRSADMISYQSVFEDPILLVRVSPDARYVAVSAINSAVVQLLNWPCLKFISRITLDGTLKAMSWHPWRSALLGVGAIADDLQAWITVWNAPTSELRPNVAPNPYSLDAMLFSERTGELIVSLWNYESSILPNIYSQLVVLSDPKTVVDQWGEGRTWLDRVRTMVFNPDGTKLATATSNDDLIIWNFLPEEKKKKTKARRFSTIPVYLDEAKQGFSIR